jgi:RsiW-degrading membrane proteinase PrsW (M82 family)
MSSGGRKEKRIFINATMHLVILGVFLLLQLVLAGLLSYYLQRLSLAVMIALYLISIVADVFISSYHDNPSTRVFWLLLIALFPAFGLIIYMMWGLPRHGPAPRRRKPFPAAADAALLDYSKQIETEPECAPSRCRGNIRPFATPAAT